MLVYKTLFEVRVLHEYYLRGADGSSVFDQAGAAQRTLYLQQRYAAGRPAVDSDISFEWAGGEEPYAGAIQARILQTYSGFKVMLRVKPVLLADQTLVFEPFAKLNNGFDFLVAMHATRYDMDLVSNVRMQRSVPAIPFFSTEDIVTPKSFPMLVSAVPVAAAQPAVPYEQGELLLNGGRVVQVRYDETGTQVEDPITTVLHSFANANDQVLVPLRFLYEPARTWLGANVQFILKDAQAHVVSTLTINSASGPVELDFTDHATALSFRRGALLNAQLFTLQVLVNGAAVRDHALLFSDELYASGWGIIHVRNAGGNPAFNLIAGDGYLIKRKSAAGVWTDAPVFEIPVKSRLAYFRYVNTNGRELTVANAMQNYLIKEGPVLITSVPKSLSLDYFMISDPQAAVTYAPNGLQTAPRIDDKSRVVIDVSVPESTLFPIA